MCKLFSKYFQKFFNLDVFIIFASMEAFKHGSLFSGIGGFDLAAEWMGWENVFHCEWNEFGQKVLKYYWPEAESFTDITKSDFTHYANKIDILTGGFPCQPYSTAGKRKGKNDDRHLWPEMLRAIREIKPRYVVGENVRGLTNWNGGMVFDEVCAELEALGYQVAPVIIPACAVNAPHRRERIWFVAYCNLFRSVANIERQERFQRGNGGKALSKFNGASSKEIITNSDSGGLEGAKEIRRNSVNVEWESQFGFVTDTLPIRLQQCENGGEMGGRQEEIFGQGSELTDGIETNGTISDATDTNLSRCKDEREQSKSTAQDKRIEYSSCRWEQFPTQSPVCGGNDGLPSGLDGIAFPKWRNESIKAYGNAIVPQVAYEIFKAIERLEKDLEK